MSSRLVTKDGKTDRQTLFVSTFFPFDRHHLGLNGRVFSLSEVKLRTALLSIKTGDGESDTGGGIKQN